MLISIRLYRWACKDFHPLVNKVLFVDKLFGDMRNVSVIKVGIIISDALQYPAHVRTQGMNCWRFHHQLDIQYGTERQILSWVEDHSFMMDVGFTTFTKEDYENELLVFRTDTPEDDIALYEATLEKYPFWKKIERDGRRRILQEEAREAEEERLNERWRRVKNEI